MLWHFCAVRCSSFLCLHAAICSSIGQLVTSSRCSTALPVREGNSFGFTLPARQAKLNKGKNQTLICVHLLIFQLISMSVYIAYHGIHSTFNTTCWIPISSPSQLGSISKHPVSKMYMCMCTCTICIHVCAHVCVHVCAAAFVRLKLSILASLAPKMLLRNIRCVNMRMLQFGGYSMEMCL